MLPPSPQEIVVVGRGGGVPDRSEKKERNKHNSSETDKGGCSWFFLVRFCFNRTVSYLKSDGLKGIVSSSHFVACLRKARC